MPHDYNKELESIRAADSSTHEHNGDRHGCFWASSSPPARWRESVLCVYEGRPPGSRVECAKRCVDVDGARMRAAGPAAVAVVAVLLFSLAPAAVTTESAKDLTQGSRKASPADSPLPSHLATRLGYLLHPAVGLKRTPQEQACPRPPRPHRRPDSLALPPALAAG